MAVTLNANTSTGFIATSDTSGVLQLQTGGTAAVTVDASQNVGIGVTPAVKLDIGGVARTQNTADRDGVTIKRTNNANANGALNFTGSDDVVDAAIAMATDVADALTFRTAGSERARIDSSGNLLVGTTSTTLENSRSFAWVGASGGLFRVNHSTVNGSGDGYIEFGYNGTKIGSITQSGTTAVLYNTTSDYRLKENVQPLSGALARVASLKPCTYTWKSAPDEIGEGFIAHELAEVCPQAVSGEKDAVNEDGSIKPQGVDTSFLVATLTAAIQEQQAIITSLTDRITALEGTTP
jgi:hypothetical protein